MAGAFTRDRVAGGETSVAGLYAEGSWASGSWLAAGGVRADRWENANGRRRERDLAAGLPTLDETDPDRSGAVVSARLGLRRQVAADQAVRLAAYTGFRPATLNELHRPFRVGNDLTEANAALEPERLAGVEAGWSWTGDRAAFAATAFWTRLDDAVVNVTIGTGPAVFPRAGFVPAGGVLRQRMNAGTIEAVGLELDVRADLSQTISVRAALSATDARVDGGTVAPQLTGLRPAQAPIWSAVAGLGWDATDRLTLSADVRWESRRFEDDLNSRVLDPALVADFRADWRLDETTVLWLAADNLFDAEVEVSETGAGVAGLGPPRTLSLGLRYTR
jgi:outer membrane receptor protein involved in Fe transport